MSQENGEIVRTSVAVVIAASLVIVAIVGVPWDETTADPVSEQTTADAPSASKSCSDFPLPGAGWHPPIKVKPERTNLVPNPSFEFSTQGWCDGVSPIYRALPGQDDPNVRAGAYYGFYYKPAVAPGTLIGGTNDFIPAVAGQTYSMSVNLSTNFEVVAHMTFCDAAGTQIETHPLTITTTAGAVFKWENKLAPANTAMIQFQIYQGPATVGVNIGFDGLLVVKETTAGFYFDGDTPGAAWIGAPHRSPSIILTGGNGKRFNAPPARSRHR